MTNALPPQDTETRAALRASIREVQAQLVPCLRDQYGVTVDGHHREQIAAEVGCVDTVRYVDVELPDDAEERAAALTAINDARRRSREPEDRREVVKVLREAGARVRAIASAVGVAPSQVHADVEQVFRGEQVPESITGKDGKTYPATSPRSSSRHDGSRIGSSNQGGV